MIFLDVLDTVIGVRIVGRSREDIEDLIEETWDWCLHNGPVDESDLIITASIRGEDLHPDIDAIVSRDVDALMSALTPRVTRDAINLQAGKLLMLHACAVANVESGDTVAFVGPSGMGKTTLALTLGKTFGYVTDETVAIRPDNSVVHYAKPLSLKREFTTMVKDQVSPTAFWLNSAPPRLTIKSIVILDRQSDFAGEPVLTEVDLLQGIADIAEEISYLSEMDHPLQRLASIVEAGGGFKRLTYRQADDVVPLIAKLLGVTA